MKEVQDDKERFQHTQQVVGRRQADVISTLRQVHDERWSKAAEGRITCRMMAEERHSRRKHERHFAQVGQGSCMHECMGAWVLGWGSCMHGCWDAWVLGCMGAWVLCGERWTRCCCLQRHGLTLPMLESICLC